MKSYIYSTYVIDWAWGKFLSSTLNFGSQEVVFGWDISLRVVLRRVTSVASRWLREDSKEGGKIGMHFDEGRKGGILGTSKLINLIN